MPTFKGCNASQNQAVYLPVKRKNTMSTKVTTQNLSPALSSLVSRECLKALALELRKPVGESENSCRHVQDYRDSLSQQSTARGIGLKAPVLSPEEPRPLKPPSDYLPC